jgi:hypothetical protein
MINLSWKTKPPTKKRKRKGNEQAKKTLARKRYLKSVRYCQRCGSEVYPNSEGEYPFYEVEDDVRGRLVVCKECYGKI